jgi:hypothetical protein
MSVNEARRGESLPDAENGDTVLQAGNMAPLGSMPAPGAAGQPGSDSTGTTGQGGDGDAEKLPDDAAPGV